MNKRVLLIIIAIATSLQTAIAQPRLIVQISIGAMRAEDLTRYSANFGEGGFRRLSDGGALFTNAAYDFQQTTTPVTLATLSTGAMPSTHGDRKSTRLNSSHIQ